MNHEITTTQKMDILFEWSRQKGEPPDDEAIGNATGESPTTIRNVYAGKDQKPGVRVMEAMARFCGCRLDYWDCQTEAECRAS